MPHMIDVLAQMGEDALSNHFQLVIPSFSMLGTNIAEINMRVLTVDLPSYEIETYEINKRGRKMTRPTGTMSFTPEISFTFRADKYWRCYNSLMTWMQLIQDNQTMAMASDSGFEGIGGASTYRTDVEVWSLTNLTETAKPNNIWVGQGAYPTSIDAVSFEESSGEPIELSVTLSCMNVKFPQN